MPTFEELHPYQRTALSFADVTGRAGLFLQPGLGKTVIALSLVQRRPEGGWLIVCPFRVIDVWEAELQKWSHLHGLSCYRIHGEGRPQYRKVPQHDIYLTNYETIPFLFKDLVASRGRQAPFRHLILDEAQRIKDPSTARWKQLRKMLPMFDRRVLLTGTPLGGGGLEGLWTQMIVLDGGRAFGLSAETFKARYFHEVSDHKWEPWPGTEEAIWAAVDPYCISMRSIDHLDMPALIRNDIAVELPAAARQQYEALERDFFLELPDDIIILPPTATATRNKLRQVIQGGIYDDRVNEVTGRPLHIWHPLHTAKLDALSDLVDELQGEPLLVLLQFRGELEILKKMFPKAPVLAGGTTRADGKRIAEEWNQGRHEVLLAHPKTVSLGLNLQARGHNLCWLAQTDSLDDYIQTEARLWRQGQKQNVIVHHIMARRTIDLVIRRVIDSRDRTQAALIRALLAYKKGELDGLF